MTFRFQSGFINKGSSLIQDIKFSNKLEAGRIFSKSFNNNCVVFQSLTFRFLNKFISKEGRGLIQGTKFLN